MRVRGRARETPKARLNTAPGYAIGIYVKLKLSGRRLGPMTKRELARKHWIRKAALESAMEAVGVPLELPGDMMTPKQVYLVSMELYRRAGAKKGERK